MELVVSANYRLSPTAKYPDHLNDAQAATDWTFNNIESFGGDLKNIYVSVILRSTLLLY